MNWQEFKDAIRTLIVGCCGNPATPILSLVGPFAITAGQTLTFDIDGASYVATVSATNPAATNVDVAAIINAALPGVARAQYQGKVEIKSLIVAGPRSQIRVTGGTLNAVLGFDTDEHRGEGLSDTMIVWSDEAQPHIVFGTDTRIQLDVTADRALGVDVQAQVETEEDIAVELENTSQRIATIQVKAEALTHIGLKFAWMWLSKIRANVKSARSRALLVVKGITFVEATDAIKAPPFDVDERSYSAALFDMRFGWVYTEIDETYDGSWIQRAEVTSPFYDTLLAAEVQE